MNVIVSLDRIINDIEGYINEYDCILIFDVREFEIHQLFSAFCESEALRQTDKKVMVMAAADAVPVNGQYRKITQEEYESIYEIYSMYEFSDRIQIISQNSQYASMLNYIKTGILTMEEMFEAWLH